MILELLKIVGQAVATVIAVAFGFALMMGWVYTWIGLLLP